jgi:hypothetical protein
MGFVVGLFQSGEAKAGTVVVALVLLFWAYRIWMNKRDFTAVRKAAVEGADEEKCKRAMHLAEKMIDAETQRRRWHHLGRDRPQGQHRT